MASSEILEKQINDAPFRVDASLEAIMKETWAMVRENALALRESLEKAREKDTLALRESLEKAREKDTLALRESLEKAREKEAIILAELKDEVNKWIGYFGNTIGYIVESVLIPGIKPKMNELGHNFTSMSTRKKYFKSNGKTYAEIDLYLENCEEVMIVEVKTQLSVKEIERQLKRLQLLRENESEKSLKGKTLYSAVAGLQIDEDAREMALKLGMYVVEMVEDTKYVNVIKPSGNIGKW